MILVDTSVLISFFRGDKSEVVEKLELIIKTHLPFGINNFIYQELLQGAKNDREFNMLNEYLSAQNFYELNQGKLSFLQAAEIYTSCRKKGITVRSTIDLLIVQTALENDLLLLHNDSDFDNIAKVVKSLKVY